jgi:hypothetical protein
MTAVALMLRPTGDGWAVYLTDGRELARYRGLYSRRRAERFLERYVGSLVPDRASRRWPG